MSFSFVVGLCVAYYIAHTHTKKTPIYHYFLRRGSNRGILYFTTKKTVFPQSIVVSSSGALYFFITILEKIAIR